MDCKAWSAVSVTTHFIRGERLERKEGRDPLENMRRCPMGPGPGPVEDRSEEVEKVRS